MIKIFEKSEQLDWVAAEKTIEIAEESVNRKGRFTIALAGGSTPKSIYRLLASSAFSGKLRWEKTFFFFGDERNVAPDAEESNYRMANENLFSALKIPAANIFRWKTELPNAEKTAEEYETTIKSFFGETPKFDLILLGMGTDGHTASLFPFTKALKETERYAVVNPVEKLKTIRLTMTFPVINDARNVIFLVKGADKAATLHEVLQGEFQPDKLPAQNVRLKNGNLNWYMDKEAARFLRQ